MLLAQDAIRKLGSVGKVIPTVAARVVDDNMNDVPVGQIGEIVYRAPTLMPATGKPEGHRRGVRGRWFHPATSSAKTRRATSGSSTARRT